MGRKRGAVGSGAVNPLQRMLGAYLRVERVRLGRSSADIAHGLGLTDTYFRLIESGRAALSQSLVLDIIATFSDGRQRPISFPQLCMYLVGMNWVSAEIASSNDGEAGSGALATLGERVAEFERFLDRTKGYFDFEEGSPDQRRYLEDVAVPELSDFLANESYQVDSDQHPLLSMEAIPTLNIDVIMDVNASLSWRPFVHTKELAAAWEDKKSKEFRELRAVYRHPKTILSEENISLFDFPYLSEKRFSNFRAIFLESGEFRDVKAAEMEAEQLKEVFSKRVGASRAQQRARVLAPEDMRKVEFVCLTLPEREALEPIIRNKILGSDENGADAYWSFQTVKDFPIAFVGLIQKREESSRNLTLQDARNKEANFDKIWERIQSSRKATSENHKVYRRRSAR